jgi:hypothetical protein
VHEQFGTYGAWLNPALGDAPRIEYADTLRRRVAGCAFFGLRPAC